MSEFTAEASDIVSNSNQISPDEGVLPAPAEEEAEGSPVVERILGPSERLLIPSDVTQFEEDDDTVYVIGTRDGKVTKIQGLDHMKGIKNLILRSCLVSSFDGVENLTTLTKLELYDNQIERISCIDRLPLLVVLDISFNSIRDMGMVAVCPLLEELYIAQNKLRCIAGLEDMKHLRILDLGANRIRVSGQFLP